MSAPDPTAQRAEAQRWWSLAHEDLRVARACLALSPPSLGVAAYHCQQAAEKTLKGLLVAAASSFRKTHDLDELADAVLVHRQELALIAEPCRAYTYWATDYRYPADDDLPPPTAEDIDAAIAAIGLLLAAA